jgi:hypothetical protein
MINPTYADSWTTPSANGAVPGGTPLPQDVLAQLERVLASPDFVASERNRRFLRHVVEGTLRGETARGYEIGTLVFGRPETFNATADPIVRIEAGKLRRDLETYYLKSGRHDPIRILLPKGAYRAVFLPNGSNVPGAGALLLLRAALLGLAGEEEEATVAGRLIDQQYPGFLENPLVTQMLELLHAGDHRVRELILQGLQRAHQPVRSGWSSRAAVLAPVS